MCKTCKNVRFTPFLRILISHFNICDKKYYFLHNDNYNVIA